MKDDKLWDQYYENNGVHTVNMELVRELLRAHGLTRPEFAVLDFGCGDGYFLKALSNIYPVQFGCDISAEAVAKARSGNPGASIRQNAKELPFRDGQFDLVFMIKSISAVAPSMLDLILREIERVLKKNGYVFIVDFQPGETDGLYPICGGMYRARSPEWSDEIFPLFTPEDFASILGFRLIDSREVTLTSYHGNEYPGVVALLRDDCAPD